MFKQMRRNDRQISNEETIDLLEKCEYGVLSTVGENGFAYGVPLNYIYIEGNIYFHCATEGSKLENIVFNDKVSLCVVGKTEVLPDKFSCKYESAIVFGRAKEVFDEEKKKALIGIVQKYSSEFMDKGLEYINKDISKTKIIKICIDHISGKGRA